MNVSIDRHWEGFHEKAVKSGRYASAADVVREGLRLVEEREAKLQALHNTVSASLAEGGWASDDDLSAEPEVVSAELAAEGF